MSPGPELVLAMRGIAKSFPGVRALDGVDFEVRRGEIHALVGENGAGKSTLLKILTGVLRADSGSIELDGRSIAPRSPREAARAGLAAIYQEVDLIPELSLAENLALGREPRRWWGIDRRAIVERARARMRELGLELEVRRPVREFPLGVQQLVCVARALEHRAKVVVYDEPTASLEPADVERLFERLRDLRRSAIGQVFVAHSLEQIFAIADRITVLRNGARVGTFDARDLDPASLVEHMLGRALGDRGEARANSRARPASSPWFRVERLARERALAPASFEVAQGEVVGLAGLVGSGRTELARTLVAAERATSGAIVVDGRERRFADPRDAGAAGVALCPEDRKFDGLCLGLSVQENLLLAWRRGAPFGLVRPKLERELAKRWIRELDIAASPEQLAGTLSGGNQQKVILARWLAAGPRLLILDEPTRGIDVGGKQEIERRVDALARDGLSVIFISSALEEVLRRSTRVLVLRDRRVVADLAAGELDASSVRRHLAPPATESAPRVVRDSDSRGAK